MITDRIWNTKFCYHDYKKICAILGFLKSKHQKFRLKVFFQAEKKPFKWARDGAYCLRDPFQSPFF